MKFMKEWLPGEYNKSFIVEIKLNEVGWSGRGPSSFPLKTALLLCNWTFINHQPSRCAFPWITISSQKTCTLPPHFPTQLTVKKYYKKNTHPLMSASGVITLLWFLFIIVKNSHISWEISVKRLYITSNRLWISISWNMGVSTRVPHPCFI